MVLCDHISKEMNELNYMRCQRIPKRPGADWRDLPDEKVNFLQLFVHMHVLLPPRFSVRNELGAHIIIFMCTAIRALRALQYEWFSLNVLRAM